MNLINLYVLTTVVSDIVDVAGSGSTGHAFRAFTLHKLAVGIFLVLGAGIEIAAKIFTAADFFINSVAVFVETGHGFPAAGVAFVEVVICRDSYFAAKFIDTCKR